MGTPETIRPDNTALSPEQKQNVTKQVQRRRVRCAGCGCDDFVIGDALYLGFLFRGEEQGTYVVALTCRNVSCPAPRTGIRLHESEFLHT